LSGLEKVVLTGSQLRPALTEGVPCTVSELRQRFEGFVSSLTKGKDASRVCIVVEK